MDILLNFCFECVVLWIDFAVYKDKKITLSIEV